MRKWYSLIDKVYSISNLEKSFVKVKKNKGSKTSGADKINVKEYELHLEENLCQLQRELKSGNYQPQAVKRVYIDKPDGSKRPLGIPTVKDRIVQQSPLNVLQPIITNYGVVVAHKSIKKFKEKVRKLTPRRKGKSIYYYFKELSMLLRGFSNYFRIVLSKGLFAKLMSWIRRRLRMMIIRAWKTWKPKWFEEEGMYNMERVVTNTLHQYYEFALNKI